MTVIMPIDTSAFIHPQWSGHIVPPPFSHTHPTTFAPFNIKAAPAAQPSQHGSSSSGNTSPLPTTLPSSSWSRSSSASESSGFAGEIFLSGGVIASQSTKVTGSPIELSNPEVKEGLSHYARSFIPSWLRQPPAPIQTLQLAPGAIFPPLNYAGNLLRTSRLDVPSQMCRSLLACPPYRGPARHFEADIARVKPEQYAFHFTALLSLVLQAQIDDMDRALIHSVPLHLHQAAAMTYRLEIPGIREDSPRIAVGDRLVMRGLYPEIHSFSPVAIEVEVVGLVKAKAWVYVKSPDIAALDATLPKSRIATDKGDVWSARYQISFKVSVAPLCAMQDAVRRMAFAMEWKRNDIARRWLLPEVDDWEPTTTPQLHLNWVDQNLNVEQKGAVDSMVTGKRRIPYLISGPPGTGKTKTLVEGVLQILATDPEATILLVAPSNTAADTLVRRLAPHLSSAEMFRLNAPNRTFAEVHDSLMLYCHIEGDQFGLPSFEQLMKFRVVCCGGVDAGILVEGRATNQETMRAEAELAMALHPRSTRKRVVTPHWTHLLVDEAGQASEPELLIAVTAVMTPDLPEAFEVLEPTMVLCGDMHQLGPVIPSSQARDGELDVSLLERLFQRDVYRLPTGASYRHEGLLPFCQLVKNYRSIAPILMVPATMFYSDTLEAAAKDVSLIQWSGLPNPKIPIAFYGNDTEESWIDEGASWFNPGEIKTVVNLVRSLLAENPKMKQKEIAVITPWREQVWRMRAKLRASGFGGVDVGNVETYQGAEFKVTIVSCVRSRSHFLEEDRRNNMGLYNERQRFNVAITRAKELLIVVGNADLLKGDPFWNGFLQIMLRNNLYRGPKLDVEMTGAYISRIESAMRTDDEMDGNEAAMFLAGTMARATLQED